MGIFNKGCENHGKPAILGGLGELFSGYKQVTGHAMTTHEPRQKMNNK